MISSKVKVAVLRGGPSSEYETSLKTGARVISLLNDLADIYEPLDIFISRSGEWHVEGLVREPHQALQHADVVWNALHGRFGEDGQVQKLLENLRKPFTGSSQMSSFLSANKHLTKDLYEQAGLLTPRHALVMGGYTNDDLVSIFRNYLHPVIVKPANSGSSIGTSIATSFKELKDAVDLALTHAQRVLVEEFVKGKEATCGVVESMRGEHLYALLPHGNLSVLENKRVEEMAKRAHEVLSLRHYSDSDFVVTDKGKIYILETNSSPVLAEDSTFHHSLGAVGLRHHDFVDHVIRLSLGKNL